jgi:uncharacterized protein (DUF433 family)
VAVNPGTRDDVDIYGGKDPRMMPAYTVPEAAWHVGLSASTVRSWVLGRSYPSTTGERRFEPVIEIAAPDERLLSFVNLAEIHVLAAIRRKHKVKLPKVREAVHWLKGQFGSRHPLAEHRMLTDGKDLFIERVGALEAISRNGQIAMKEVLALYLRRIARDAYGMPILLFPFTTSTHDEDTQPVTTNPRVQFGRPCISGTGIPTLEVAERYKAGESMQALSTDFGCSCDQIEAAIRYEFRTAA